ncbi:DUF262 domain-containing protein [Prevotella sp. PCHR]|uniref:DUF262 domain-containing protein n=1 Tax=Xylanibacter caecicola TaxID=2736294 RepID=A0ABX2B6G8_9BACT|nr:DUF262 domain-containing protein [Xylanibacter caecicola]NPE25699.1 DUF262 domain-containing protein [Xylanibacter caecicola]
MKGDAQPLIKFFDGSDKRFIIPLYQRNYDWKEENCEQLFQDLMKLHQSNRKNHFFGSIVSSIRSGTEDRYIIDGQQRITTVSLMLIAMVNAKNNGLIDATDTKLAEKIFKRYLVDEYQEDERKVKLKPIKKDMQAFDTLLYRPKEQYIKESNVTRNYEFFYDKVIHCGLTVDELFDTIKKLEVINIRLDEDDDPQLIFESLNSTGLDLSEADKIRNYLLMSLTPTEQDDLYTRFWNPIEEKTKYDPSSFVRDYLTMKQGKIGRIDKIYFIFKEYAESLGTDRAVLLEDMYRYACIYNQIDCAHIGSEKLNRKLNQLRTLDSNIAYPFFMAFFDYTSKVGMSEDEIYRVIDVIEAYWARRIICNLPSNVLNKVFATLHRDILNHISKSDGTAAYIDVLVYVLLKKGRSSVFPSDEEIAGDFTTRQVYKMPVNQRMFILERMENRDNNERHDVVKELTEKNITIEHIMPQTLSDKWKRALGDDWERVHQQYLHTMANITLTGYNSQYSNLTFAEKRDMEKGFKESAFRLNNYVKGCEQWTETELKERQQELLNVFMKLWPKPASNFKETKPETESASLDDEDFEFTGKKLQAYILHGVRYPVNTWKEMLIQVCGHILLEKRSTVEWLCANEKNGFYTTPESWRRKLATGLYVWTDNSTATKISILNGLFMECNIPASELTFEFRSEQDGDTGNDE